jgi:hypothetical protein
MDATLLSEIQKTLNFDHGGSSSPSEETKRSTILEYGKKYNCDTLIETGTHRGDTVEVVKNEFRDIYSIELGPNLYKAACERFKNDTHIHLILGDACEELAKLLECIPPEPNVLFYLDAHSRYDETSPEGKGIGTSAMHEIDAIRRLRPDSVVLIDDARLFTHKYNATWPELTNFITAIFALCPWWNIELKDDMIRLVPKN